MSLVDDTPDAADVSRLLAAATKIIGKVRYCWLLTADGNGAARSRPMGRVPRDADGDEWTIRFITDGRSRKAADMRRVGQVSLLFQHDPEDAFILLAGKASLAESRLEVRKRWTDALDAILPSYVSEQAGANAIFVDVDVERMELWIRGVTPEPFGQRATILERDAGRGWRAVFR